MKIAIVGAQESKWTKEQKKKVKEAIEIIFFHDCGFDRNITLVSGHCPYGGVDIWAEEIADDLKIKKEIYKSLVNQWEDSKQKCNICHGTGMKDMGWHKRFGEWEHDKEACDNFGCIKGWQKLRGYKSRNIQIAEVCDILYCIEPKGRTRSGGIWTMNYAKKLGKKVYLVKIE